MGPCAMAWPVWVMVRLQLVLGWAAARAVMSRARAGSMGPNPPMSPGPPGSPSRVVRGTVRLMRAASRPPKAVGAAGPGGAGAGEAAVGWPGAPGSPGVCRPQDGAGSTGPPEPGCGAPPVAAVDGPDSAGPVELGGAPPVDGPDGAGAVDGPDSAGPVELGGAPPVDGPGPADGPDGGGWWSAPGPAGAPGRPVPGLPGCGGFAGRGGGGGVAAEEGVEVGAGAEFVQGAGLAGFAQVMGPVGEVLVGFEHVGGRQPVAGQGGGAGVFAPPPDPRVFLGLFPAPLRGCGVDGQDRPGQRRPQLPGGLLPRTRQDPVFGLAGVLAAEDAGGLGDDPGPEVVDDPGAQRRRGAGQPDSQIHRQIQAGPGGRAGQRQGGGDLVGDELAGLIRELARRRGRSPVRGAAAGQLRGHRQGPRRGPGLQPPPRAQRPDQLIIIQAGDPARAGSGIGQPGQRRARRQFVQVIPGPEPRPRPEDRPGPGTRAGPGPEPRAQHLRGNGRRPRRPDRLLIQRLTRRTGPPRRLQIILINQLVPLPPRTRLTAGNGRIARLTGRSGGITVARATVAGRGPGQARAMRGRGRRLAALIRRARRGLA